MAAEFPGFKLVAKRDSTFMRIIGVFLLIVTLGGMRRFMTGYTSTVGSVIYTPAGWEQRPMLERIIVLRHERIHLRQRKEYGSLLFALLYLFFPLPFVFAYYRMKFEREAYEETIRATVELIPNGHYLVQMPEFRHYILKHFSDADYLWMWPFKKGLNRWYDDVVSDLQRQRPF